MCSSVGKNSTKRPSPSVPVTTCLLYTSHLEEGIHTPIIAYEFLNKFYVQEDNKRVSVLKYFDAVRIAGTVTRLVPERNDSLENRIYYERCV